MVKPTITSIAIRSFFVILCLYALSDLSYGHGGYGGGTGWCIRRCLRRTCYRYVSYWCRRKCVMRCKHTYIPPYRGGGGYPGYRPRYPYYRRRPSHGGWWWGRRLWRDRGSEGPNRRGSWLDGSSKRRYDDADPHMPMFVNRQFERLLMNFSVPISSMIKPDGSNETRQGFEAIWNKTDETGFDEFDNSNFTNPFGYFDSHQQDNMTQTDDSEMGLLNVPFDAE